MADQNTINRIGGILKNVYSDAIVEQQNLAAVARKLFTKAKGVRLGGDHLEVSVRARDVLGLGVRLDYLANAERECADDGRQGSEDADDSRSGHGPHPDSLCVELEYLACAHFRDEGRKTRQGGGRNR